MELECDEALFGGAAGGGKSFCLLDWLAEGVSVPGYSGIVFRRTYPQLEKSGDSLIEKAHQRYPLLGGRWNGSQHKWRFPSGAIIEMGHLTHENTVYDYQGAAYQRIAFDELTQFSLRQYLYMFSRLRRPKDFPIKPGVRSGSNPGGIGHLWVKQRFVNAAAIAAILALSLREPTPTGMVFWPAPGRAFFPSRLIDNPYLDIEDYESKLSHLDPVTRARLMKGDWSIHEEGRIKAESFRRYVEISPGRYRLLNRAGEMIQLVDASECVRFFTVDPAGTSAEKAREARGKPPSHSVVSIIDLASPRKFITKRVEQRRCETPDLVALIARLNEEYRPAWIGCENTGLGLAVCQELERRGLPVRTLNPGGQDKATRAATFENDMAEGRWFFPLDAPWMDAVEGELLVWTGHPDEPFDIGDTLAYASRETASGFGEIVIDGMFIGRAARG